MRLPGFCLQLLDSEIQHPKKIINRAPSFRAFHHNGLKAVGHQSDNETRRRIAVRLPNPLRLHNIINNLHNIRSNLLPPAYQYHFGFRP